MDERRQSIRVPTPVLIEFPNPTTMKTERSYSQDVSETGLRFPTTLKLAVGQQMVLTIQLPFSNTVMHTTGEVQWIKETSRLGDPQYEVGVKFIWIEDPDRRHLARHLTNFFPRRV